MIDLRPAVRSCLSPLLMVLLLASGAGRVAAQATNYSPAGISSPQASTPAVPASPSEKARVVLEKHCARCHQRQDGVASVSLFDDVMALDDVARRADLVAPGRPDASRLYHVMLSGHVPEEVFDQANPAPSAEEIDDVRSWLESLKPVVVEPCVPRRLVTLADQGRVLSKLSETGGDVLKDIRFISLAQDRNSCIGLGDQGVEAVRRLVDVMRGSNGPIDLPLAADDMPIHAVRLSDLGWDASQWDALAALAAAPHLAGGALREVYNTETPLIDAAALAAAMRASGDYPAVSGLGPDVQRLVRAGSGHVDVERAASELGLPTATMKGVLSTTKLQSEGAAIALQSGPISQTSWRQLRAVLDIPGDRGALYYDAAASGLGSSAALEVFIWPSASQYKKDDLVVVTAQPTRDCNLTVISIDTRGEATVLFPSDSDPDNAVKGGSKVRIPSDIEPYQLRASERGIETFVAVCTVNRKRLLGVDQDFEKQRFSALGDWRTFLKTAAVREALVGRRDTPRQRRARAKAAAAEAATVKPAEQEARAAIYVRIE